MTNIEYKNMMAQKKNAMEAQNIQNNQSFTENMITGLGNIAGGAYKIIDYNAEKDAQDMVDEQYDADFLKAIEDGYFDTIDGRPIGSQSDIESNIDKFNKEWLDSLDVGDFTKRKIEEKIKKRTVRNSTEALSGVLERNNTIRSENADKKASNILGEHIENYGAYREKAMETYSKDYDSLSDQQKQWYDSNTEWSLKALNWSMYLESQGYKDPNIKASMTQFIPLAKQYQVYGNFDSFYSKEVLNGSMSESDFWKKVDSDLQNQDVLNLLSIESPNNTELIRLARSDIEKRVSDLKNEYVDNNTRLYTDNFQTAITGILESKKKVDSATLNLVLSEIGVNPEYLDSKTKTNYEKWKNYATKIDYLNDLSTAVSEIENIDPNLSEEERNEKVLEIYNGVANKNVQATLDMMADSYYADSTNAISIVRTHIRNETPATPDFVSGDKSSITTFTEADLPADTLRMANLKVALEDYDYEYLEGTDEWKAYMEANPDAPKDEARLAIQLDFDSNLQDLSDDDRAVVNRQAESLQKAKDVVNRQAESLQKAKDVKFAEDLSNDKKFESYAYAYVLSTKGNIGSSTPMVIAGVESELMQYDLDLFLRWVKAKDENGNPLYQSQSMFEYTEIVDGKETKPIKDWFDSSYNLNQFKNSMDVELLNGMTVREKLDKFEDDIEWSDTNLYSTNGFVTKGAPKWALDVNQNTYNDLEAMIAGSMTGGTYFISDAMSEVSLAYHNNLITEEQYKTLTNMFNTFTSESYQRSGINIKEMFDTYLNDMNIDIPENDLVYTGLLSQVAEGTYNNLGNTISDPVYAKSVIMQKIKNATNSLIFQDDGKIYSAIKDEKIDDVDSLYKIADPTNSIYRNNGVPRESVSAVFELTLGSSSNGTKLSQYYVHPFDMNGAKVTEEDMKTMLFASVLGVSWDDEQLKNKTYKQAIFNMVNDLDDTSKSMVIATVQYGMETWEVSKQMMEDYGFSRMSLDGTTFYTSDNTAMEPTIDRNGDITGIEYTTNKGETTSLRTMNELNDRFMLQYKDYFISEYSGIAVRTEDIEKSLDDFMNLFVEKDPNAKKMVEMGFVPELTGDVKGLGQYGNAKSAVDGILPSAVRKIRLEWRRN